MQSIFEPAGPAAAAIAAIGLPVVIGFTAAALVLWLALAWIAWRRHGSLAERPRLEVQRGHPLILWGGLVVPVIVFALVFIASTRTLSAFVAHGDDTERTPADARVTGHQWWWEIAYLDTDRRVQFATANELHIPVGTSFDIDLESADVIHSWWVPRLHGKVDLVPGRTNRIRIGADTPGVYVGMCAEFCGAQHTNMGFRVIADTREDYDAWLAAQRRPAAVPHEPSTMRGLAEFETGPCALCHSVRGTRAQGSVGPDLTHLAGRRTLAAGMLDNDAAALHAWVVDAPALKPGTQMPALPMFDGPALHALVSYLQSLE